MHSTLKIDNEVVNINPLILFSQLILLAEHGEETTPCLNMTLQITLWGYKSLFKGGVIRNGDKASLCSFLMKGILNANLPTEIVPVNDGEALLNQINSFWRTMFADIYKLYKKHLYSKYRYCYVVFECYVNFRSTKDMQHTNRSDTGLSDITFISDEKFVKS